MLMPIERSQEGDPMPSFQKASFGKPKPAASGAMPAEEAERIGLAGLVFLTSDEPRLTRFLADTGLTPHELAAAAGQRETLAAVLDHLLSDESLLLVFAADAAIDPAAVTPAHIKLVAG
jgi:hypothetical protein